MARILQRSTQLEHFAKYAGTQHVPTVLARNQSAIITNRPAHCYVMTVTMRPEVTLEVFMRLSDSVA